MFFPSGKKHGGGVKKKSVEGKKCGVMKYELLMKKETIVIRLNVFIEFNRVLQFSYFIYKFRIS